MPHPSPLWRGLARDKRHHRFLKVLLYIFRSLFFRGPADLADHYHRARLWILVEQFQRVDMRRADDRIPADSDAARLPDSKLRQLIDRLVSQRARARHDPDVARLVDVPWH